MNTLIDRMITRVQRPISPVEPRLSLLYAPRLNVLLDSIDSTPATKPPHESHFRNTSNHSDVGPVQAQQNQDADPQPLRRSSKQRPADTLRFDPTSHEPHTPTLPAANIEHLSPFSHRPQQDSPSTQSERPIQNPTHLMQEAPEKEHTQAVSTRRATLPPQDEGIRKTERSGVQGTTGNQIQSTTTEVNISIGHIEVRAIQRAEPARRSVAPSHVTLDDYLRRRPGASQ